MNYIEKAKEFEQLNNDVERWNWIKENSEIVTVWLDNDVTFATLDNDCNKTLTLHFDYYIGNDDGIEYLLDGIGVKNSNL